MCRLSLAQSKPGGTTQLNRLMTTKLSQQPRKHGIFHACTFAYN